MIFQSFNEPQLDTSKHRCQKCTIDRHLYQENETLVPRSTSSDPHAISRDLVAKEMSAAKALDLIEDPAMAEGVETTEQMNCQQALGCQQMQGYRFSRPLDSQAMTAFLTAHWPHYTVDSVSGLSPSP